MLRHSFHVHVCCSRTTLLLITGNVLSMYVCIMLLWLNVLCNASHGYLGYRAGMKVEL